MSNIRRGPGIYRNLFPQGGVFGDIIMAVDKEPNKEKLY